MARFVGFRCDGPNCSTVEETEKEPPGWIKVTPIPKGDVPPGDQGTFVLCSNRCLARLGKARFDAAADRGEEYKPGRRASKGLTDG